MVAGFDGEIRCIECGAEANPFSAIYQLLTALPVRCLLAFIGFAVVGAVMTSLGILISLDTNSCVRPVLMASLGAVFLAPAVLLFVLWPSWLYWRINFPFPVMFFVELIEAQSPGRVSRSHHLSHPFARGSRAWRIPPHRRQPQLHRLSFQACHPHQAGPGTGLKVRPLRAAELLVAGARDPH